MPLARIEIDIRINNKELRMWTGLLRRSSLEFIETVIRKELEKNYSEDKKDLFGKARVFKKRNQSFSRPILFAGELDDAKKENTGME